MKFIKLKRKEEYDSMKETIIIHTILIRTIQAVFFQKHIQPNK